MWTPPADASWKPSGTIHAWRYLPMPNRSFGGWHITFDAMAAESLNELVDRLRVMNIQRHRTIPLTQVTARALAVVNAKRSYKPRSPSALKLIYNPIAEDGYWRLEERENTLELEMSKASLDEFASAIAAMRGGDGDFSLGRPPLWFWWYPR